MKHQHKELPAVTPSSDTVTQLMPPAAPPGTRMVIAPGVKPQQGILGVVDIHDSEDSKYEPTSTQIQEKDVL